MKLLYGEEKDTCFKEIYLKDLNYILLEKDKNLTDIKVVTRYQVKEEEANLYKISKNKAKLEFKKPHKAITKGQSAVFYKDDIVIGGGKITDIVGLQ